MIDYKKLGRIGLDSGDQTKVDTVLNVDHRPLISQYNNRFIKYGFVEVKDNKYNLKMSKRERDVFQITKSIGDEETGFAYDVIGKLLSDDTEERLKKENDLIREDAQVDLLTKDKKLADIVFEKDNRIKELEIINKEHQKLNGELSVELKEVKADNRKLAEQVDRLTHTPDRLRKKGLM